VKRKGFLSRRVLPAPSIGRIAPLDPLGWARPVLVVCRAKDEICVLEGRGVVDSELLKGSWSEKGPLVEDQEAKSEGSELSALQLRRRLANERRQSSLRFAFLTELRHQRCLTVAFCRARGCWSTSSYLSRRSPKRGPLKMGLLIIDFWNQDFQAEKTEILDARLEFWRVC
jgi:hypothetical protein